MPAVDVGGARRFSGRAPLILLAVAAVCVAPFFFVPPGTLTHVELRLEPPFTRSGDRYLARASFPRRLLSSERRPPRPLVYEDGKKLSRRPQETVAAVNLEPAADPRQRVLAFQASDRSDPNTNGRSYCLRYPGPAISLVTYLALILVVSAIGFVVVGWVLEQLLASHALLRRISFVAAGLALSAGLLQWTFAVAVAERLAVAGAPLQRLYDQTFYGRGPGVGAANSMNFAGHPYLNYTLNPDAAYLHERQFNRRYLIRRKEPIRPRSEVDWRALIIGGSTTFGTPLPYEEQTWVYHLEEKVRRAHGPDYDVINGGVPGYNLLENFFHYLLLLEDLDPDLVVLYVGINDVHPRLRGDVARDYSNSRIRWDPQRHTLPPVDPALAPFTLYRYLIVDRLERRRFGHLYDFVQKPFPPAAEWKPALERNGTGVYEAHLRNFLRVLVAQGRRVVIVPQVYLLTNERERFMVAAVAEHNDVNERLAREFDLPFAAEVAAAIDLADLVDTCHFSVSGGAKMADRLDAFLSSKDVLRRREEGRMPIG